MRTSKMLSQKFIVAFLLWPVIWLPHSASAVQKRQTRLPIASVDKIIRKHGAELACKEGTPMNGCIFKTVESCKAAFTSAIDTCLDQSVKVRENFMLTKDQQRTLLSATLTCSQAAILKTHPASENNKCLSEDTATLAKGSFENRYMISKATETQTLDKKMLALKSGVPADRRGVCPTYKGTDASGCTKALIKSYGIHSAASANTLMNLLVQAANIDRTGLHAGPKPNELTMVKAQLWLLERIDPKTFTLAQMKPLSIGDQMSRRMLILIENQNLEQLTDQVVSSLEQRLPTAPSAESERAPASVAPVTKDERLRKRLAKIKARIYKIS